ncbi:hypothetical protein APY94_10915 [Thermococcus celericrescens]|uniref:DUF2095 domain-containing protein n=1 Tax=Thermococcus celericrescens TaxID=227598 RepID=A0A100XW30_9EURY|nr:DUF2095 family protein [Thermococcus celericrescens]KUH32137.1 hypothetical protein APY94_10915 [Thermococcus celericrescens]
MDEKKTKKPADDFAWQEYEKEDFERTFPALARELEGEGVPIEAYRTGEGEESAEREEMDFSGYNPTVIDFLRRCSTDDEALEIINWMEERGEITHEMAKELRITLVERGVRAFGSKKEWGWYERHRKT